MKIRKIKIINERFPCPNCGGAVNYARFSPRALIRCSDRTRVGCAWVEDPNDLQFPAEIVAETDPRCTWAPGWKTVDHPHDVANAAAQAAWEERNIEWEINREDSLIEIAGRAMAEDEGDPYDPEYSATYSLWNRRAKAAVKAILDELGE